MGLCDIFVFCQIVSIVMCSETGFNLWFTTNKEEIPNREIAFDKPLPKWLRGTFIRNGPAQYESGDRKFINALDGFAKLVSVRFPGDGSAFFNTKFILSETYTKAVESNTIEAYLTFGGVNPPFNEEEKLECFVREIDNMDVNVYNFSSKNNRLSALTDAWKLYEFDKSLNTIGSITPHLPIIGSNIGYISLMSCAHPLPEYKKDSHISFFSSLSLIPGQKSKQTVVRILSTDDREAIADFELDAISYTHSFSVTENYAVFFNAPYHVSIPGMLKGGKVTEGIVWNEKLKTDVYVVHLGTGKVTKYQIDNVMVFHHINAFELPDGRIVTDVSAHTDPYFSNAFTMSLIVNTTARKSLQEMATATRYIFDLKSMTSSKVTFQDPPSAPCASRFEVPTINEKYRSQPYCFVYGIVFNYDQTDFSHIALVKKDVCNQKRDRMLYIPNNFPTEAWFVPSPTSNAEDDGILFSTYLDGHNNQSYLAILDAKTLNITHKAILPTVVPFNFHGHFFPDIY